MWGWQCWQSREKKSISPVDQHIISRVQENLGLLLKYSKHAALDTETNRRRPFLPLRPTNGNERGEQLQGLPVYLALEDFNSVPVRSFGPLSLKV